MLAVEAVERGDLSIRVHSIDRALVVLPAGVIERVDVNEDKVYVSRTKDEIKAAPEYDDSLFSDERYRDELGTYYGPAGRR